jgi:endonuclease/exonuclease/phosphatase family metal-dependent hydrolase
MKSTRRIALVVIFWFTVAILVVIGAFLCYATIYDFRPPATGKPQITGNGLDSLVPADSSLTIYSWNIGYCGLGKEMDCFSEGGKMVRPSKEQYKSYREGVVYQLTTLDRPDFLLLQEVDSLSKRTYRDNQVKRIEASFSNYSAAFALNYKVNFVPIPLFQPLGKVTAGQLTLSKWSPAETERHSISSSYRWPKKLFMRDRCYILSRFNVSNGKQLVLINLHNSALSDAADKLAMELASLKTLMVNEYLKGNYVIAGGDWNQNPLPYDSASIKAGCNAYTKHPGIPPDFIEQNWQWAFDPSQPTNRNADKPYQQAVTPVTTIDFFILSPNVELRVAKTIETGFSYSDHQPIGIAIKLR